MDEASGATGPYILPEAKNLPIYKESFFGKDWLSLRLSEVYKGVNIPRGNGEPVVLVPGFLSADLYLWEMYLWLKKIGYTPYLSNININAMCLDTVRNILIATIIKVHESSGQQVHLIGHSLGGVIARSAAVALEDKIASLITLGSPLQGVRSHPFVLKVSEGVGYFIRATYKKNRPQCYTPLCDCPAVQDALRAHTLTLPRTAIYTKKDGVVDWEVCQDSDTIHNYEVTSTHIGLAFNADVYRIIADRLKTPRK